ncbi:MAG: helix-turn-helix transcriptional regulator [Crocinitomicaceae bacterium]|nr:helix-turn-helix transcriptional regulator [Crocinitomicaceae bacterium]
MARLFKALAHPARLAIVENVIRHQTLSGKDLQFYIPLAQSTISQHLKELHVAGIIDIRADGNKSMYSINKLAMLEITKCIDRYISQHDKSNFTGLYVEFNTFKPIHYPDFGITSCS